MAEIKNILFDLGNVLIEWDPRRVYQKIWQNQEKMEYFLEHICSSEWNRQMDAGCLFKDAVNQRKAEFPEWQEAIEMWETKWEEMLGGEVSLSVQVLRKMHKEKKYRLFALSNWSHETFPIAVQRFSFLKECFEGIVVSGEVKMAKPDRDIFEYTLKHFQIKAEETIFIDDSLANVQTANDLGFKTIHFVTAEQMQKELKQRGVEV